MPHRCAVCDSTFVSKFSLKRHMGVKHLMDIEGRRISSERQDYLRHQSDKIYIRNGERTTHTQSLIKPTNSQLRTSEVQFDTPMKHIKKQFVLIDPMLLDKIYSSMHTKVDSKMIFRGDDDDGGDEEEAMKTNDYRQPHHKIDRSMSDRHYDTPPIRRQSQHVGLSKKTSSPKQQWTRY